MPPLRILLVDDHAAVRRGIRSILETEPQWTVCCEATNGREAIEQVRDQAPDLVLLDVSMPELDGLQAARDILRMSPATRVLFLTTHQGEELRNEAQRAGVDGVVLKSDAEMLIDALRDVERQCIHLAGSAVGQPRHIGALFASDAERHDVLRPFVAEGLARRERVVHIVGAPHHGRHVQQLAFDMAEEQECFHMLPWEEMYLAGGRFDQQAMLGRIRQVLRDGSDRGFPMTRLVAHMEWALEPYPGVEDLIEYESRLNDTPFHDVVLCAYDLNRFDGRTIMGVLRTHPMVVVGGALYESPFYEEPGTASSSARSR